MAAITSTLIKELRERTAAGMSDCKNALVEAEGDIEKAVEVILKKGIVKAASRAGKIAAEGEVATWISPDHKKGVIVEINCQTDFVARGDDFKSLVANIVKVASTLKKGDDLASQKYPGTEQTIDDVRAAAVGRIGENIVVRRWDLIEAKADEHVSSYVHMGGKLAVIAALEAPPGKNDDAEFKGFVENVGMQIAAMGPLVVDKSHVSADQVSKQKEIYQAQMQEELDGAIARLAELDAATDLSADELKAEKKAAESRKGPPQAMWPKVIEGKVSKWYNEVTLHGQDNVWDPTAGSIDKVRNELGKKLGGTVHIHSFVRFSLGEGIDKKTEDLAAEVAKTIAG